MDLVHAPYRYTTFLEVNEKLGFTALKLQRVQSLEVGLVAEVVFWDASGQFVVKTFEEVPVRMACEEKRMAAVVRNLSEKTKSHLNWSHPLTLGICMWMAMSFFFGLSATVHAAIPASERSVLDNIYTSTSGASWTNHSGWEGAAGTECTWFGVACDPDSAHVTGIYLYDNNLIGTLPPIAGLTQLSTFYVPVNQLSGSLPPIYSLFNLSYFDVDGNQFSGSIPSLSGLAELETFYAYSNNLSGAIPSLDGLPNLIQFNVSKNLLTGPLPPLVGLAKLKVFDISVNQISGALPSLQDLTSLQYFLVGHNHLSGDIPLVPSPNSLVAGQSGLCPNPINITIDTSWDDAVGVSPWSDGCTSSSKEATFVELTSNTNPVEQGQSAVMQALVIGWTPTGTMSFKEGNDVLCDNVAVSGVSNNVTVTCSISSLGIGSHSITAFYSGDNNNYYNFSVPLALNVVEATGRFYSVEPARMLDTRVGGFTIDGAFLGSGALGPAGMLNLMIAGRASIPAVNVAAVVLNLTATNPTAAGYLTAWPCGQPLPFSSNLNFVSGATVPNLVVVPIGTDGAVSLFNSAGTTDIVVDAVGYFTSNSGLHAVSPQRLLDTRSYGQTVDGQAAGVGAVSEGRTLNINVAGRGGIPNVGTRIAILNVTATNPTKAGFVTVFASQTPQPFASNLNFIANETVANLVITPIGADGQVTFYNSAGTTDLIADFIGWMPANTQLNPVQAARLMDTRTNAITIDGSFAGNGAIVGASSISLTVQGRGGVPLNGVDSVILNVTATNPTKAGYITVWPTGTSLPTASNLNFVAGQTVPNLVFAKLAADGTVSLYNSAGTTDLVVDVVGWFSVLH